MATLLSLDPYTSRYFRGFAWKDSERLPFDKDVLYVINTDSKAGKGEHWCVAASIGNEGSEFWDPYGSPPDVYELSHLWNVNSGVTRYNPVCVQNLTSKFCGNHCLFYAFHKCRGYAMDEIVKRYDHADLQSNDRMVEKFVNQFGSGYKIGKG